jgi:hypothetical protein
MMHILFQDIHILFNTKLRDRKIMCLKGNLYNGREIWKGHTNYLIRLY